MTDPVPAGPKPAPIPLVLPPHGFTDPKAAFRLFPLANAVTVDGHSFGGIGVRRFTVAQVAAISDNYRQNLAQDPEARMSLPFYVDPETGQDLPPAVLDLITPDEMEDLDRVTADFLPRRFRPGTTTASDEQPPADGSDTAPSS